GDDGKSTLKRSARFVYSAHSCAYAAAPAMMLAARTPQMKRLMREVYTRGAAGWIGGGPPTTTTDRRPASARAGRRRRVVTNHFAALHHELHALQFGDVGQRIP